MSSARKLRLFLDSNVLTGGIVSSWGLDKAVLSLCAAKICRLVLAEAVRDEVEANLLLHAERLSPAEADELIENYRHLIELTKPELISYPDVELVRTNRHLIRHEPDWFLSNNTRHFTSAVARRTGLRIATPVEFFKVLSSLLR